MRGFFEYVEKLIGGNFLENETVSKNLKKVKNLTII